MKMRRPHAVPLSRFVAERFLRLYAITGPKGFVFPAVYTDRKPMSENTLNAALRRMGFSKDEICAHGFRSTASTILNECGQWSPDAIERALGHKARDTVRGAYDRGERWQERVRMAEWWSAYLERIKRAVAHDKNRFVQSIAQGRFPRHPQRIDQAQINTESRD
jgi:integrase